MRLGFLIVLLGITLFGSGFWYNVIDATCRVPIRYRIGTVSEQFGTSKEEIQRIAARAEAVWEEPLKTELFVYDESEDSLSINLIFDERQETADREAELRADLDAKEGMSESVALQYEKLILEFRTFKKKYESRVVAYEAALKEYNTEVNSWNDRGGAPQDIVDTLREEERTLKGEQGELETLARRLNAIVTELNQIGARGNELITDYNSIVEKYNSEFNEDREFAQGDYTQGAIDVYQFDSEDELTIVLAHEFGHSLSIDHVANEESIMYYLMEKQTIEQGITDEDRAEFKAVCTEKSVPQKIISLLSNHFAL